MAYINLIVSSSYITNPFHKKDWLTHNKFNELFERSGIGHYDSINDMANAFEFTRNLIYSLKGDTHDPWGNPRRYGASYSLDDRKYIIKGPFCEDAYAFLQELLIINSLYCELDTSIDYAIVPIPGSKCTVDTGLNPKSPTIRIANSIDLALKGYSKEIMTPLVWATEQDSLRGGAERDDKKRLDALVFDQNYLKSLKGKRIILFDDVVTRGSTMKAAYRRLHSYGLRNIICYTISRPISLDHGTMLPIWPDDEKFYMPV